jgi:hypothetical protein
VGAITNGLFRIFVSVMQISMVHAYSEGEVKIMENGETKVSRKQRPQISRSMLRRVEDFVLSAETIASGYHDDPALDSTWGMIFTSANAQQHEIEEIRETSGT